MEANNKVHQNETVRVMHLRIAVENGGGKFIGLFDAEMKGVEPLVLFNSPTTGSTLALKVTDCTADVVRQHIAKQDEMFQQFCEKACTRVFRQFSGKEAA